MNYLQTHNGAPDPGAKARASRPPRQRSQHSMPFDPEDLTRRLNVVIAQRTGPHVEHVEKRKDAEAGFERNPEAQSANLLAAGATRAAEGQVTATATATATMRKAASTTSAAKEPSAPSKAPKVKASRSDVRKSESTKTKSHRTSTLRCAPAEHPKKHADQDPSRYVPRNAAAQFERTTTTTASAETGMQQPNLIHKLSRRAMKFHLGGPTATTTSADSNATAAEQARVLRKARDQHDMVLKRNQFQRDRILEEAAEAEEERELRKQQAPRHLVEGHLFNVGRRSEDQQRAGGALGRVSMSEEQTKRYSYDALGGGYEQLEMVPRGLSEHRVDWTQSDEAGDDEIIKPAKGLPLRRANSILTLRARLGNLGKHGREDKIASPIPEDDSIPSGSPLSPRSGFFARFKLAH